MVRPALDLPFYSVQIMETLAQNSRLDAHEKQIQQLQSDVSEIKTALNALEVERDESREFRKEVLNWMTRQAQKTGSGGNFGEVPPYSRPQSVSDRDSGPKYASDGDFAGGLPSLIAQLEVLVSRSEERLRGYGHLRSTNRIDSRSSGCDSKLPTPDSLVASVRYSSDQLKAIISRSGSNMTVNSLPEGETGSKDVVRILVPPTVFPNVDFSLQWNSILCEGVPTLSVGRLGGSENFFTVILFQQPSPMTTVVAVLKISDRRLSWKGGTVPYILNPDATYHKPLINIYAGLVPSVRVSPPILFVPPVSVYQLITHGSVTIMALYNLILGLHLTVTASIVHYSRSSMIMVGCISPFGVAFHGIAHCSVISIVIATLHFYTLILVNVRVVADLVIRISSLFPWLTCMFLYTTSLVTQHQGHAPPKLFVLDREPKPPDPYMPQTSYPIQTLWLVFRLEVNLGTKETSTRIWSHLPIPVLRTRLF